MTTKDRKSDLHDHYTAQILALPSAATEKESFHRTGPFPAADRAAHNNET